jgi:hypothetical protein
VAKAALDALSFDEVTEIFSDWAVAPQQANDVAAPVAARNADHIKGRKPDTNFTALVLRSSTQVISTRKTIEKVRNILPECELDTNGEDLMSFRELLIALRKEAAVLCNDLQETVKTKRLVGCGNLFCEGAFKG